MDRLLLQAVYRHSEQSSRVQGSPVGIVRLEKQPSTNIELDGQYWALKLGPTMDPRWPKMLRRWLKMAQDGSTCFRDEDDENDEDDEGDEEDEEEDEDDD